MSIRRARRRGLVAGAVIGSSRAKRSMAAEAAQQEAAQQEQAAQPIAETADSTIEQLKQLAELKDQGVLTQEEFDHKKKQILGM